MRFMLLGTALIAVAVGAQAQVFKWVDANGVTQYGDRPGGPTRAERVILRDSRPGTADAGQREHRGAADEAFRERQQMRDREAEQQRANAITRCDAMRNTLARQSNPGPRLAFVDKEGRDATETQVAESNARLSTDIRYQCGG